MGSYGFGNMKFTTLGLNLLAKAQTGTELKFTRIAVGDGYLNNQDETALTDLIEEKMSLDITNIVVSGSGAATIEAVLSNTNLATGFYWREIGVFATDPDLGEVLYGYDNCTGYETYIPPASTSAYTAIINAGIYVSNASSVTATISTGIVATPTTLGTVEIAATPVSGNPIVGTRMASVSDIKITSSSPQSIAAYTPSTGGNFEIAVYLRVLAKTNVIVAITYTDTTGTQTKYIKYKPDGLSFPLSSNTQPYGIGSYILPPSLINAVASGAIAVSVTAGAANIVYASAVIMGV